MIDRLRYFDREGRPVPWERAMELFAGERHVGLTALADGTRISTVHLVLNHGVSDRERPVIFETMVFDASGNSTDCTRYATFAEAAAGHEEAVRLWGTLAPVAQDRRWDLAGREVPNAPR